MRWRWLVPMQVVVLLTGSSALRAEAESEPNLADRFLVRWASIQYKYNKSVTLHNGALLRVGTQSGSSKDLTLSCLVGIREPDRIVGTSREASITRITDGDGREMDMRLFPARPAQYYEGLRYGLRPLPPPRWKKALRSLLRLPPENDEGRFVAKLQPSEMEIRLNPVLLEQADPEIDVLEGYFYALVAESLDYVEVPFEANDRWVRVTPELEIRVRKAQCTQTKYEYDIETRAPGASDRRPLRVGYPVPSRAVVALQFIRDDGELTLSGGWSGGLPARVGGKASGPSYNARIKTIRLVVAVNASHRKIPFGLKHIPLPDPNE
jgi:hypothetical protein